MRPGVINWWRHQAAHSVDVWREFLSVRLSHDHVDLFSFIGPEGSELNSQLSGFVGSFHTSEKAQPGLRKPDKVSERVRVSRKCVVT